GSRGSQKLDRYVIWDLELESNDVKFSGIAAILVHVQDGVDTTVPLGHYAWRVRL
ncbi:hypothetical protein RRG08_062472, partial [Elysia crispata]